MICKLDYFLFHGIHNKGGNPILDQLMSWITKIKSKLVDKLNLILTNLTLYDQHYVGAISDSPTGLSQTIVALAAMLLLIVDIPSEIIFY